MTDGLESVQLVPAPRKSGRHIIVIAAAAVAAVLVAALVGVLAGWTAGDSSLTIQGVVVLTDRSSYRTSGVGCVAGPALSGVRQGAQVVITDGAGATIGLGQLGVDQNKPAGCTFEFSVDVPDGSEFYGISVAGRDRVQFRATQLSGPIQLSIG